MQHKKEEYIKAKKAAEEAEILKKKAIQREKVNLVTADLSHITAHVLMLDVDELHETG